MIAPPRKEIVYSRPVSPVLLGGRPALHMLAAAAGMVAINAAYPMQFSLRALSHITTFTHR